MNSNIKQTCILIPGMHRSGTSALTGTLRFLDVYLGTDLMPGNFANEKGYFENNTLFIINEKLLSQIQSSWDDVFFDETKPKHIAESNELKNAIINEFEASKIFAIKDPRLIYLFPVYEKTLTELLIDIKIILPYRNPVEVANSLNRRDNMPLEKALLLWAYNFLLAEKFTRQYERIFVNFDDLITNTHEIIKNISLKLAIPLEEKYKINQRQIHEFLEPSLKHHNIPIESISKSTPKIITDILSLKEHFNDSKNSELTSKFDLLHNELFSYKNLFYNKSIVNSLAEGETAINKLEDKINELSQINKIYQKTDYKLTIATKNLKDKEDEIERLKNELTKVYNSKSWKATKPFRKIMKKLKKL